MVKCKECVYFDKNINESYGLCRKKPPIEKGVWPKVYKSDWCGSYEYKL